MNETDAPFCYKAPSTPLPMVLFFSGLMMSCADISRSMNITPSAVSKLLVRVVVKRILVQKEDVP